MRSLNLTFFFLIFLAMSPALSPADEAADPVAVAKAKLKTAYDVLRQASKQFDAAQGAAWDKSDASPEGKALLAKVAATQAAMEAAAPGAAEQATAAYEAAERELNAARSASAARSPAVASAAASRADASKAWIAAKAEIKAAEARKIQQEDAADPTAKHRREVARAIKLGQFIKGMTEAEADASAKTFDDPEAPPKRFVDNEKDGTRFITYIAYWRGDPKPRRSVRLTFKNGVVIDISDFERQLPQVAQ